MESFDEIAALMAETPVSDNHGRKQSLDAESIRSKTLGSADYEIRQGLQDGRIDIVHGDESYYGLVAHRGVLTEEEAGWLDWSVVERQVEAVLGCTYAELAAVYGPGRPDTGRSKRRDDLDARLLDIQQAGGNMHQLAIALGWPVRVTPTGGSECQKMSKALARARGKQIHEAYEEAGA